MTFKNLSLTVVFSFILSAALCQDDFKEGFVMKAGGKYTYGYISFTQSPHLNCVFKERKENAPVTYTTDEIEAYGLLGGNHFRKKTMTVAGESTEQEVFMEAVEDGTATLYIIFGRMFIERGSSFYELKDDKDKRDSYRSILVSLLSDCASAAKRAKSIVIEAQSLKSLVKAYNVWAAGGNFSSKKLSSQKGSKAEHFLGVFAGVDRTQLSISNSTISTLNEKSFTDRTLISGGLHYKMKPSSWEHFAIVTGLWFNDQRFYLIGEESADGTSQVRIYRIEYKTLRLPFLIEVGNFTRTKLQPYIKAGITIPLMLTNAVTISEETENNNTVYFDNYTASKNFKEPVLLQALAGASYPIGRRLHVFGEVYYSRGKKKFSFEVPATGWVKANFVSTGVNLGLVIRNF